MNLFYNRHIIPMRPHSFAQKNETDHGNRIHFRTHPDVGSHNISTVKIQNEHRHRGVHSNERELSVHYGTSFCPEVVYDSICGCQPQIWKRQRRDHHTPKRIRYAARLRHSIITKAQGKFRILLLASRHRQRYSSLNRSRAHISRWIRCNMRNSLSYSHLERTFSRLELQGTMHRSCALQKKGYRISRSESILQFLI